jgi:secondary thiamine-phosphate synthase enzyme
MLTSLSSENNETPEREHMHMSVLKVSAVELPPIDSSRGCEPRLPSQAPAVHHANPPLPALELEPEHGLMRVASKTLEVFATRTPDMIDITERVTEWAETTGINHGQLVIHSLHTTAAVVVNEREPLLHEDVAQFLEELAPMTKTYRHDDFDVRTVNMTPDERANGHAHLKHLMLGSTETLPVIRGRVTLGRWQRIFVIELDEPRPRQIVLQLLGIRGH